MELSEESLLNQVLEVNLADDLQSQNFDVIRLASYRTGVKLRFIQRRTHIHLVDVWNLIEAYRENGLNAVDPYTPMTLCRLETLLSTIYVHLNKRVPITQQLHVQPATIYLMQWIVQVYNAEETNHIPVFTVKMLLAVLCGGKLTDKLRYVFSQMSDSNGQLLLNSFDDFLQQILLIMVAIGEEPSFHYTPLLAGNIFPSGSKVTVNDFLDTLLGEPGPPCLIWLPLLHRIAAAESVVHPVQCNSCQRSPIYGLRYQCGHCPVSANQQCQECFWRGVPFSESHKPEHDVREYYTPPVDEKNPKQSNSLGSAFRRSLRCVRTPESRDVSQTKLWRNMEGPEKSFVVTYSPSTPSTIQRSSTMGSTDTWGNSLRRSTSSWNRDDDEHGLIARYANKLASMADEEDASAPQNKSVSTAHQLLAQLETKNQEILREIARIRREQENGETDGSGTVPLMEELAVLRQRKGELEQQLHGLQDSRKQLMGQLETLMKMIKNQQLSPRSSPSSSASPSGSKSPTGTLSRPTAENSVTAEGDSNEGRTSKLGCSWRQDLLSAADSVTVAMSSLVKEFKGEEEDLHVQLNGKSDTEHGAAVLN